MTTRRIKPTEWRPEGIRSLEPAADRAVRSLKNTLIVAGPGAGKTELLAQRACYLLKTGLCESPRRILAISFKRDAARNLRERVNARCGIELARRFDSLTFDAFSKGLVDRFLNALPANFRPSSDYQINLKIERGMRELLNSLPSDHNGLSVGDVQTIGEKHFYRGTFLATPLAFPPVAATTIPTRASQELWQLLIRKNTPSQLDFPMIGRIAELILRQNELILHALRSTYAFVFLDEFQDTTNIHYDLTRTGFKNSSAIITAVGDDKQRIMGWAGALEGVFAEFTGDFSAVVEPLLVNHRSAPELVRIQHYLIRALDSSAPMPESSPEKSELKGECRVIVYDDYNLEANHIAELVARWIHEEGMPPRQICLLARQTPDRYTTLITEALSSKNVHSRIENELQDLLAEPLVLTVLAFLRLSLAGRSPSAWNTARHTFFDCRGIDAEHPTASKSEQAIKRYCNLLSRNLSTLKADEDQVKSILHKILEFVGVDSFRNHYPQYRQGSFYDDTLVSCAKHLSNSRRVTASWLDALDHLEGTNSVPIMTIHKSKGLEYHTVVFVGLEDSALWNFRVAPQDETCAFFVAFSRAISRVVFTFSQMRPRRSGLAAEGQSRNNIASLYDLLTEAGVKEQHIQNPPATVTEQEDCPF